MGEGWVKRKEGTNESEEGQARSLKDHLLSCSVLPGWLSRVLWHDGALSFWAGRMNGALG